MPKYHLVCILPKSKFKRRLQHHGNIPNILNREFHATQPLQKIMSIYYLYES